MEARTVLDGFLNKLVTTPVEWTASLACRTHVLCKNVPEVLDGAFGQVLFRTTRGRWKVLCASCFAAVLSRFVLGGVVYGVVWCGVVAR